MKNLLKSYMVFTSTGYRIFALVLLPLVILGMSVLLLSAYPDANGIFPEFFFGSDVVVLELFSDFWLFSGICSKESKCLDYIKTSHRGDALLKKGVVGDLVRRFVYMMVFAAVCYAMTGMLQDFAAMLIGYIVVVAGLNLTRYLSVMQLHMAVSAGAMFVYAILSIVCWFATYGRNTALYVTVAELAGLLVLAVGLSVVTVWHMGYRMKGSYYER